MTKDCAEGSHAILSNFIKTLAEKRFSLPLPPAESLRSVVKWSYNDFPFCNKLLSLPEIFLVSRSRVRLFLGQFWESTKCGPDVSCRERVRIKFSQFTRTKTNIISQFAFIKTIAIIIFKFVFL